VILQLSPEQPFPANLSALSCHKEIPGLVAIGGDLSIGRLTTAYRNGLFPWFSQGQPILWWSPDPRMVLKTCDFKLHRSLRRRISALLRVPSVQVRVDSAFDEVVRHCALARRDAQAGTWITQNVEQAYIALHHAGYAHSFELWIHGQLHAGLYGVNIGRMFFGESMFTRLSDGSKLCLFALVSACKARGVDWIDCQQVTSHLASLGAAPIDKELFVQHLNLVTHQPQPNNWAYDRSQLAQDLLNFHVAT
jgi:leucyl/phenylalanyl-tRNA---protein transferase